MNKIEQNAKIKRLSEISRQADRVHRKLFAKHTAVNYGIHRSQHRMLAFILANKSVSQKQIAENFNISAAAVAVTLKKLEAFGLVEREAAQSDGRRNNISVTAKGEEVINETKYIFNVINQLAFADFTDEEIEKFHEFSERMLNNLIKIEDITTEQLKGEN